MTELLTPAKNHQNINSLELIRRRQAAGLSQRELAEKIADRLNKISLSHVYIVQIEHGNNPDIPTEIAQAIEQVLAEYA